MVNKERMLENTYFIRDLVLQMIEERYQCNQNNISRCIDKGIVESYFSKLISFVREGDKIKEIKEIEEDIEILQNHLNKLVERRQSLWLLKHLNQSNLFDDDLDRLEQELIIVEQEKFGLERQKFSMEN